MKLFFRAKKQLAILTALCLLFQDTGLAQVPQIVMPSPRAAETLIAPNDLRSLPALLGTLDEVWLPKGLRELPEKSILFIQDPHGIQEAQKNMEGMLDFLQEKKGVRQIFIEGGIGELEIDRLRFFEDRKLNRQAAEFLLQESEAGGPELFLLSQRDSETPNASPAQAFGLESKDLYLSNLNVYQTVMASREKSSKLLEKHLGEIERAASRSMTPELYRSFSAWVDYEKGKASLEQDLNDLQKKSREILGAKWGDPKLQLQWPMLVRFFEAMRRQSLVEEAAVEKETAGLLNWIEENSLTAETEDLQFLLRKKSGEASGLDRRRVWEKFYQQASAKGFRFEDYPQLVLQQGGCVLAEEVEAPLLFKEKELLRNRIFEKLQKKTSEKDILEAFRDYLLLKKLFSLELTQEEYQSWQERFPRQKKIPSELRTLADQAARFYTLAMKRDTVMAAPVISRLLDPASPAGSVVIVAGGFHRKGMTEAFRKHNLPYAVLSPHFSDFSGSEKYQAAMTGKTGPFDLSRFQIRAAQWMSDWQGDLPAAIASRREALEQAIVQRGAELGALPRTSFKFQQKTESSRAELRVQKVWKDLDEAYKAVDRLAGSSKTFRPSEAEIFLKFIRHQKELEALLTAGSDRRSIRKNKSTFYSTLTDWFEKHLYDILSLLEQNKDVETLGQLLEFSRTYSTWAYGDQVETSLKSVQETQRSELRAQKPWKDLAAVYDDIDLLTGLKKTPGRKKQDPTINVFLKFVRYETEVRELIGKESDLNTVRILFSTLTDWLDGNLSKLLPLLEEQRERSTLGQLLDFSRRNMESPYADRLIADALGRVEAAESERRREARKQTIRKTATPLRPQPKRFSARPKSDSVRPFSSPREREELLRALQAEDLPAADDDRTRIKIPLGSDFFKGANPWLPLSRDAVKLSFPKSLEGKTVILEEDALPGDKGLRQIRLYENTVEDNNYLFSFIESETLGFSRSNDSFFVSPDYTFTHPQFPEETFWVLTTQNFDVQNPQNKFRVITDAQGNLLKVIDASATVHPVYEVYDEEGKKRKGFFVMRMDGIWAPSEDFRGVVKGFLLGREKSQRGSAHDTAYVRVPGKNIYVAPGAAGLKKAEVTLEGRTPVSVKVGDKTYDLILKRNESGALVDVAREGFYDKIGSFTGTITRFKADSYGRASLGAPITGVQVADASKDGVWMSAALENGVLIRTDEWKNLPPAAPYVFEMEKTETAGETAKTPQRVVSVRLAENKSRPKATHDFLVLRDFQGKSLDSYKLRIQSETFEKHAGQVTGFTIHARGDNAGRLQIKGRDYQLPGEYRDHPVTLLHFPEEKKLIFIVHSKTRTQIKDAYIYEMEGGEYAGGTREAVSLEKELKSKYKYPFDLSRVWREKIRSEETYEAARVAFEHGDLNAAEQILRGVSIKARRYYRLAQQLLNTWIPKRRTVLSSGNQTQQRRLLASFAKAAREDLPEGEDGAGARSELRDFETNETLFWAGALAGTAVVTVLAFYRFRLVYRRIILDDYDDRVEAIRAAAAEYRTQSSDRKPSQRLKARQKLTKEFKEKFKRKKDDEPGLFATVSSLVFGGEASGVYKGEQLRRAERIEKILENRLAYELALIERSILLREGADSAELGKAWPQDMRLPLREKIRNVLSALKAAVLQLAARLYRGLLESLSGFRGRSEAPVADQDETGEPAQVLKKDEILLPAEQEEMEVLPVPAAVTPEETQAQVTPEQKLTDAVDRFRRSFSTKMEFLRRQAAKAESVRRLEQILQDFDRELKADESRIFREASLEHEMAGLFSEQTVQAVWVVEARSLIQQQLETLRVQKEQQAAAARSAREALEAKKLEAQQKHARAIRDLTEGFAVLEKQLRDHWKRMILTGQTIPQRPEALEFGRVIQEKEFLDNLDRRLWQRRLADLVVLLQEEFEERASSPWAVDGAVNGTPDALALAESNWAAGKEDLAQTVFTAIVWDLDRDNAERNRAVRYLLGIYHEAEFLEDTLLTADNLVWLISPEPETTRLLAELWVKQSGVYASKGQTSEARDALSAASSLLAESVFDGDALRSQIEDAARRLGAEETAALPSVGKVKSAVGTRQAQETSQTGESSAEIEPVPDFDSLLPKLEEKLLAGAAAYDRETLQGSELVIQMTQQIVSARLVEDRREALLDQLDALMDRVAEGFRKARVASAWKDLDNLEIKVREKLKSYSLPQDVFEDAEVKAFPEVLETLGLEDADKAALSQDFIRRMNVYGAFVWREMNRRGLEYVRKHSRSLNDFMHSVSVGIEKARSLQQQGRNFEAFQVYEAIAEDVRNVDEEDMPYDVQLSTLSRVIVAMSNTRRYDHSQPNRYDEALQILNEALENVDPWSPFLAVEKGWVLYHWGQHITRQRRNGQPKFEQALTEAEALLLREPRDSSALDLKITSLVALNRKSEAVALAHWTEAQGIRKVEKLTAAKDLIGSRAELRADADMKPLAFGDAETLRERAADAAILSPRWIRVGEEPLRVFSDRRAEIEAQPPHPELTGTLLAALQRAYQERNVPFALERWLTEAYEKRLKKIREKEFGIYLFDWIDHEERGQVAAYYDETANRLFLSRELLKALEENSGGEHALREGLLFEMLFPPRKVLVLGASGRVGREVYDLLRRVYPQVMGTSFSSEDEDLIKLDVTQDGEVDALLNRLKPDVVVYAAGVAGVEEAEKDKARAELLNVSVPERIAQTFPGQMVYFSTDYVFDGTEAPYKPKAETKPLNFYGETKVAGEKAVLSKTGNTVIRLGWVYGSKTGQERDPFHSAIQWMEGRSENLLVLDDHQVRHPVWAGDVAGVTLQSINNHRGGIVQLNGSEALTRYTFTEAVRTAYEKLYPSWDEPPGNNLTSTRMWHHDEDEAPGTGPSVQRPQDAKMRNTIRPTPLDDVLRYLIPMHSVPDEGFFQELYAALETRNFEAVEKISKALESRNIRWAFVGRTENLPGASEKGVKVWSASEREEMYRQLSRDIPFQPSNAIRFKRGIDSMLMGIPEDKDGIIFLKPMTMGKEPHVEISLFPSFAGNKSMLYLLSYGYMEASSFGRVFRLWIPTQRSSDYEIDETVKTELAGGSYSQVQRIINTDGTTVIEKRAKTQEDKGKLLAEARYMQDLQKTGNPAGRWFPEIYSVEEHDGWTVVRMQDLSWPSLSSMIQQAFPSGDDAFGRMMGGHLGTNQSLLETIKHIYRTLTPDFYSQEQSPTPEDFAEKYHFQKLEQRWREAAEKSPWMKKLLAAPYLEMKGEKEPLLLNLPTMLRVFRRINQLHPELFKPPYLAKQHGDLHTGNILIDPFEYLRSGKVQGFKLIDPKYIPEGNDPLYDFAKLIHNYFGYYDLALDHHDTFHFDVNFPSQNKGPAVFANYFDDEASGTLMTLGRIGQFSKDFMEFIMDPDSDQLFPFEPDSIAWRKRLLFTHASLMAGLLPFHVVGDNREKKAGVIYFRSAELMSSFLGAIAVSPELGDSEKAWHLRLRLNEVETAKALNNKRAFEEAVGRLNLYLDQEEAAERLDREGVQDEPSDGKRSELRAQQAPWVRDTDQDATIAKAKQAGDLLAFTESDAVLDLLMQTLFQIRLIPEKPKEQGSKKKTPRQKTPWDIENPAALVVDRIYQFWHQGRRFGSPQELAAFFEPLEVLAKRDDGVAPFLVRGLQAKLLMMAGFRDEAEKEVLEGWPKYDQENYAFALAMGDTQAALSPYTAIGLQHLFAAMHKDLQMVKYEAGARKDNDFDSFVTLVRSYHYWREARSRWDSSAAHYQESPGNNAAAVSRARRAAVYAEERIHLLEEKYSQELGLAEIPEDLTAKQELEVVFNRYRLALAVITPTFQYHVFNRLLKPALEALALDKSQGMQSRTLLRAKKAAEGLAEIAEHSRTHTMGDVTIYEDVLEILATAQVHTDRALRKFGKSEKPSSLSPFAARLDGLIDLMDREIARGYSERQRSVEIYYPKLLDAVVVFEKILRSAKKNSLKGRDLVDLLHQARVLNSFFAKEPDSVYDNHKTFLDSLKEKGYEAEALNEGMKSLEHFLLDETHFNLPRAELRYPLGDLVDVQSNLWRREGPVTPFPGVTLEMIERAQKILKHFWTGIGEIGENDLREGRFQIPLVRNEMLNQTMKSLTGRNNHYYLYYLPELPEGSFKPYLAADLLTRYFENPEKLSQLEMVVAESTGNQGKAVASLVQKLKKHPYYAPYAQQLSAVIFVPRGANPEKVKAMKDLGAVVVNRQFSEDELRAYARASEAERSRIDAESKAPYFEAYKDASQYVDQYAKAHPDSAHYIRHGSAMGVAAYAVIMLEALDQWFRLQVSAKGKTPVSSADFQAFTQFVGSEAEFDKVRFWVPGGSAGLGSGIAQAKLIRPGIQVFLTQVPGVDHIFNSLKAGRLIPKDQAVFDPTALRYVDGIAATGEPTTYAIVRGMADAVMRVPYQDNNRMARLILSLGLGYVGTLGVKRYLESELSPFLPLTNAVYGRKFEKVLPALAEEGKHIIVPVTGRTTDWQVDAEIRDLDLSEAIGRLRDIAAPEKEIPQLFRSELRTEAEGTKVSESLDFEEHQRLRAIAKQVDEGDYDAAHSLINAYRIENPAKPLIQQNLNFFEARMLGDAARFDEAAAILDSIELQIPAFKDAGSTRPISAQKSIFELFKKYKARLEGQDYEFVKKLGAGTFGDAYLFRNVLTGQKVVLKVIGGTSLDITDAVDKMSTQGQLSVEIDVNDNFFSKVGDAPEKEVIPRNLQVFEEENELGISMPEAIVMTFVEGKTLPGFLQGADNAAIQRFQEQFPEKWLGLIESLKEGGYVYIDYRPDNFFFSWDESQNLVIKSVDRGIIMKFKKPEAGSDSDPRELAVLGSAAMFKVFSGKEPALEYRNRLRAVFELGPEQEAYLAASLRPGDEANMQTYQALLEKLRFELKSRDGQIGYRPGYEKPPLAFNLVLIPHGETDANKRGVFHGHSDAKDENLLNEDGKRQVVEGASKLAEWIQQQGLKAEGLVFLRSPLRRTQQTSEISLAEAVKTVPGLPAKAEVEPDSIEINFAEWDGKDAAEVEAEMGAEEKKFMEAYRNLNALMKAPGGENFLTLLDRARELLLKLNEKYAGKTVVLYGHGTMAAAMRILFQSPEVQVDNYLNWRKEAVPPRGEPTVFMARSELRLASPSEEDRNFRTQQRLAVAVQMTAGILPVAFAAEGLPGVMTFMPSSVQARPLRINAREKTGLARSFSNLIAQGGKAVLPARIFQAVSPRVRELFVELFVQGAVNVPSQPVVYIAGEGASAIKETFFTYGVFQKNPSAQRLFEVRAQEEAVMANRLKQESVAVSLAQAPAGDESLDASIPAFLLNADEIRKLGEEDQARLLVRMTQLQLLAAVELKDQLGSERRGEILADFLRKAGVTASTGPQGYLMPSIQSLLSETVGTYLAAYQATAKAA